MAPLQQELSRLEVEPLEIVVNARRDGFDTPPGFYPVPPDKGLDTLTALDEVEIAAIWEGTVPVNNCCCCCCPGCCCC
jgi:hypothetical protein